MSRPPLFRYSEKFEELCPYYMAMGMSYDEYWNGDNMLPRYFRKKYQIEAELQSRSQWMQGAYFYESMLRAAPIYNFLSKKRDPVPYLDHPYPVSREAQEEYAAIEAQKKKRAAYERVKAWAIAVNEQFHETE